MRPPPLLSGLLVFALMHVAACGGRGSPCCDPTDRDGGAAATGGSPGPAVRDAGAATGGRLTGGQLGSVGGNAGSAQGRAGAGGSGGGPGSGGQGTADAGTDAPPATVVTDGGTWKLVWSDEFDVDGAPNAANWGYERGFVRNQELQWYQPGNATVADGILTIAAQQAHGTNPNYQSGSSDWKKSRPSYDYTSTSMTTSGKHAWQYGRFEMRSRIDTRQGSWPAFWILGESTSWPQSGEVDIMEYYANKVLANVCTPSGSDCSWDSTNQSLSSLGSGWSNEFHVWAMEWDAAHIDLYLDGKAVNGYSVSTASSTSPNPYATKKFYILINLAIGGNGGDPSHTTFPVSYQVDYVRVYQKAN